MFVIADQQFIRRNFGRVYERDAVLETCSGIQRAKKSTSDALNKYRKYARQRVRFKHDIKRIRLEKYWFVGFGIPQIFRSISRRLHRVVWVNGKSRIVRNVGCHLILSRRKRQWHIVRIGTGRRRLPTNLEQTMGLNMERTHRRCTDDFMGVLMAFLTAFGVPSASDSPTFTATGTG